MLARGTNGTILVSDTDKSRRLYINGELQGGAFLSPGADTVDPSLIGPGPVSEAKYALGWLVAGFMHPTSEMVMVGLGAGTGAVQLLENFPQVVLTVVEIDPQIVDSAFKSFPLLDYFSDLGRLQVITADAAEFFTQRDWRWEVGMADAYTGKSYDLETSYFPQMCAACDKLYVNAIDTFAGERFVAIAHLMGKNGHLPKFFFQPNQLDDSGTINTTAVSNWVMTDDALDLQRLLQWVPFPRYTEGEVDDTRQFWKQMIASAIDLQ